MPALQAVEMIGTLVSERGEDGTANLRDGHWDQDRPAPAGALVRNLDANGQDVRSLEDQLAASCGALCLACLEHVQRIAGERSGLEVAASDLDELQDVQKLYGFYAVEWG